MKIGKLFGLAKKAIEAVTGKKVEEVVIEEGSRQVRRAIERKKKKRAK